MITERIVEVFFNMFIVMFDWLPSLDVSLPDRLLEMFLVILYSVAWLIPITDLIPLFLFGLTLDLARFYINAGQFI
jgi:hypothetical protein